MSKQKDKTQKVNKESSILFKIIFALVIIVVYGQTIRFGFVLDDDLYIVKNPLVQNGIYNIPNTFLHGISEHFKGSNFMGYRPATVSLYIIEKSIFGMNPQAFHFVNLFLYSLIAFQLYELLKKLMPKYNSYYSFLIVLLFLLHPIHTEVVSNIKSQDELLSGLCSLLAINFFIRWINTENIKDLIYTFLIFLIALFSKESTIAYLAIFPVLLWLVFDYTLFTSLKKAWPVFLSAVLFLLFRSIALKGIVQGYETSARENILYAANTFNEIWATKLEIIFMYFKKSVLPFSLSWDYSFNQIPVVNFSSYMPSVSLLVIVALLYVFLKYSKSNSMIALSIIWFAALLSPTCNVFIMNGTTFGERFLFMPILGIIILFVLLLSTLAKQDITQSPFKANKYIMYFYLSIIIVFLYSTMSRAAEWKDNITLFQSGVMSAPNSSRTNVALATEYMNLAEKEMVPTTRNSLVDSALYYFNKTVQIDSAFSDAWYKMGLINSIKSQNQEAIIYYRRAIKFNDKNIFALNNLAALYVSIQKPDSAYYYFSKSYATEPINNMTLTNLTVVCSLLDKNQEVIRYGSLAIKNQIGNQKIYLNMANAYRKLNNIQEANKFQDLWNSNN